MTIKKVYLIIFGLISGIGGLITFYFQYLDHKAELFKPLYEEKFLAGNWTTDANLVVNSGDYGLDQDQPLIISQIIVNKDGSILGEISSEGLCKAMPLTWDITLDSPPPKLWNYFVDRKFTIRELVNGKLRTSPPVAEVKLAHENQESPSLTFKVIWDKTNQLPKTFTLGKDLPSYKSDYDYLQQYCADVTEKFNDEVVIPAAKKAIEQQRKRHT